MSGLKKQLKRSLTWWEAIIVIASLAILAGLGYEGYQFVAARVLEARVEAAIPKVRDELRQARDELIPAIEAYKAHFGAYPPDHVISRQPLIVDPITNTLVYELAGVVYNPRLNEFQVSGLEGAKEAYVKSFFQIAGFTNCAETADRITPFLRTKPLPVHQLHDDPDVFVLGFQVPYDGLRPEVVWQFDGTPWRYVSSAPTNNPGKFDLWIELKTKKETVVVGNWKAVE